jgi:hypothetical protein
VGRITCEEGPPELTMLLAAIVMPAKAGIQYAPALDRASFRQPGAGDYWIPALRSLRPLGRNAGE